MVRIKEMLVPFSLHFLDLEELTVWSKRRAWGQPTVIQLGVKAGD